METEGDVDSRAKVTRELSDVCAEAARGLCVWALIVLTCLRLIVTFVLETCAYFGSLLLSQALRVLPLNTGRWLRHEAPRALLVRAKALALKVIMEVPRIVEAAHEFAVGGFPIFLDVISRTPGVIHCACARTTVSFGWITSATLPALCKTLSDTILHVATQSWWLLSNLWISSGQCRRTLVYPCGLLYLSVHRLYNGCIGKIQSRFPEAFEAVTINSGELIGDVSRFAGAVVSGLSFLAVRARSSVHFLVELVSRAGFCVSSHVLEGFGCPTGQGSRFPKEKPRHFLSSLCWRMFHLRSCSPRFSFVAILVVVSILLSSFLYLSHTSGTGRLNTVSRYEPELLPQKGMSKEVDAVEGKRTKQRNRLAGRASARNDSDGEQSTVSWRHVSNVISLMGKDKWTNRTMAPNIKMEELMAQIAYLREEMISEKSKLPVLSEPPLCTGDLRENEVEDLFCIPKPKYLSHIKNPCWYSESLGENDSQKKKLRCLPYFHILGCAKAGTTDLWNRLLSHPHVIANDGLLHKEALWWSWNRYGYSGYSRREAWNFSQYVDLFQDTARIVETSMENDNLYHQIIITGDASPPDFWDFRGWTNVSQNRNLKTPRVITPHLMKHFYRNPKFILMFRDPIDRLYSDYFFVGGGLTSLDFHNDVLVAIGMLYDCVKKFGIVHCFYDHTLYVKLPLRLPFACYSVFMREWLQVFPLENFLLIKTEEYQVNPEKILKNVMEFLGLGPLKETVLQAIVDEEKSRITLQRRIAGPMKNETRAILRNLLVSCSQELARLVKNKDFTWN